MRPALLLPIAAVIALAGCGGHTYDRQAHEAALAAEGITVRSWDNLLDAIETVCETDDMELTVLGMTSEMEPGDVSSRMAEWQIHIEHVCPDRLDDFEAAVDSLGQ